MALGLLAGCRQQAPGPVAFDFIARFRFAEVNRELAEITFGTPAARVHLRRGWSGDETAPGGRTFVWSEGDESTLELFLASVRPLKLAFRCAPLGLPGSPPQTVSLLLNGRRFGEFRLDPGPREYRTLLPVEGLNAGINRLAFRYSYTRVPAESGTGSPDRRRLAVAWYSLRLGGAEQGAAGVPQAEPKTATLRIPLGAQVDYYLRLPEGGALTFDGVTFGGRNLSLVISLRTDDGAERVLATLEGRRAATSIPLAGDVGKVARIGFRAAPKSTSEPASGWASLARPALRRKPEPETVRTPRAGPAPRLGRRPHVFIYLVDTLRADHLGCYGYRKPVSPHIDAFAREASVFRSIAQSSWTKASVASLFTGLPPIAHGAQDRGDTLTPDAMTLSELLGAAAYRTYALYANSWVSETFGIDQGFRERRFLIGPSDRLNRDLFSWLRKVGPEERLFVYVHTIDPHAPYAPPAEFRVRFTPSRSALTRISIYELEDLAAKRRRGGSIPSSLIEEIVALYDAEIAFNDLQFGRFLEELKRHGLYEDSLIVLTSDHGEEFFDHGGVSHGQTLYAEVLDVPMIVKWPRGTEASAAASVSPAQHVDLLPTILDLLHLPSPPGLAGRSLLQPLPLDGPADGKGILSYLDLDTRKIQSVTEGVWKLIRYGAEDDPQPTLELYDLEKGGEAVNVREQHPIMAAYLLSQLKLEAARHPRWSPPPQAVLSEELKERLRALGYLR